MRQWLLMAAMSNDNANANGNSNINDHACNGNDCNNKQRNAMPWYDDDNGNQCGNDNDVA